jgi:hypothetical protein
MENQNTASARTNGSQQDWATSYAGLLDEFRVYNAPLSDNEVKSNLYLLRQQIKFTFPCLII